MNLTKHNIYSDIQYYKFVMQIASDMQCIVQVLSSVARLISGIKERDTRRMHNIILVYTTAN